jgi:hypothetical protein
MVPFLNKTSTGTVKENKKDTARSLEGYMDSKVIFWNCYGCGCVVMVWLGLEHFTFVSSLFLSSPPNWNINVFNSKANLNSKPLFSVSWLADPKLFSRI